MTHLPQILLLLAVAVAVVLACQRLQVPTSLGYLLVGLILGPHTAGPQVHVPEFAALAEFGVVFLLFTIGLNFSLPQLQALRGQVLGLGTGQVAFTTAVVAIGAWALGLPAAAAFVIGAAFAQSSTTIMANLLKERGEDHTPHARLGVAMSVFQDVTAVPFLVIIPALGAAVAADVLAWQLGAALAKAALAFALVFFVGRVLLSPLMRSVVARRSAEVFTLTVLLIALLAAWTTHSLGLSLAFGGFLAGMILGETEFRHQVEAAVRPFRDALLGLFFVGIGMRFDLAAAWPVLHWSLLGAVVILASKAVIVAAMMRRLGLERPLAWRTGLLLAVGGEFGLALIAVALDATAIDSALGQIGIGAILLAMVAGAVLIRFNGDIAGWFVRASPSASEEAPTALALPQTGGEATVVIGGYGRVGHTVAVLLQASDVPVVAFDTDVQRVAQGRASGHAVHYGDIADPELLAAAHVERAALVILTIDDTVSALKAVTLLRSHCPQVPVVARARNLADSAQLREAGAVHAHPDAIEASLQLGAAALQLLHKAPEDIGQLLQGVREGGYRPVMESAERPAPSAGA